MSHRLRYFVVPLLPDLRYFVILGAPCLWHSVLTDTLGVSSSSELIYSSTLSSSLLWRSWCSIGLGTPLYRCPYLLRRPRCYVFSVPNYPWLRGPRYFDVLGTPSFSVPDRSSPRLSSISHRHPPHIYVGLSSTQWLNPSWSLPSLSTDVDSPTVLFGPRSRRNLVLGKSSKTRRYSDGHIDKNRRNKGTLTKLFRGSDWTHTETRNLRFSNCDHTSNLLSFRPVLQKDHPNFVLCLHP